MKNFFERFKGEKEGEFILLVNNVFSGVQTLYDQRYKSKFELNGISTQPANPVLCFRNKKFYDCDPVKTWDDLNQVGLRNHYICTTYATK